VLSADAGRVARLENTAGGGLSVYATDPSGQFVYYYAHLDAYRPGLAEGQPLARGDTIGTVGTTGNAPPGTPHLHFAITLLGAPRRWWDGTPINPWPLLTAGS
jgi:murein DD-endopeptidase MepM/ murein hydrolase activator NlpD